MLKNLALTVISLLLINNSFSATKKIINCAWNVYCDADNCMMLSEHYRNFDFQYFKFLPELTDADKKQTLELQKVSLTNAKAICWYQNLAGQKTVYASFVQAQQTITEATDNDTRWKGGTCNPHVNSCRLTITIL